MAATKLEDVRGLTVEQRSWSPNQAMTLQVRHAVEVDDVAVLSAGDEVTYTDPELGFEFQGRVTSVSPNFSSGEGVTYSCADAFRTLTKTPAFIVGANGEPSSKIKFEEGTLLHDAIDAILGDASITALFPGGIDKSGLANNPLPEVDKGGQFIDVWLDDLLEVTDGGIVYVDPNGGFPKLIFKDYYAQPDLTLRIGDFEILVPNPNKGAIMEGADAGKTLDRKYKEIQMEGCGEYTRREDVFIPAEVVEFDAATSSIKYRWLFPEGIVTDRFLDADGKCRSGLSARCRLGFVELTPGPAAEPTMRFDIPDFPIEEAPEGGMQGVLNFRVEGVFLQPSPPSISIECFFTYTSYDGPLVATRTSVDPALGGEGVKWENHPEFFKFTGDTNVDNTPSLQALADRQFRRFSEGTDIEGSIVVNLTGFRQDIVIGAKLTNAEFADTRVQNIVTDYEARSATLAVSTVPLRETFQRFKQEIMDRDREDGTWFRPKDAEGNCFCGGDVFQDEAGATPSRAGGGGPLDRDMGVGTFHCVNGRCEQRDDGRGQWNTLEECERDCATRSFEFIDCVGCMPREDNGGEFATLTDCDIEHIDPEANCDFNCDFQVGCIAVPRNSGTYLLRSICEAACEGGDESGSGDPGISGGSPPPGAADARDGIGSFECSGCQPGGSFEFVKAIVVTETGEVKSLVCESCSVSVDTCACCTSGHTGTVSHVVAVDFGGQLLTFQTLQFSCGLLISVSP